MERVAFLLEFLPYIQRFRNHTFVIKIGGAVLQDGKVLHGLAGDISVLYNIGIRLIVVHGGGPQADVLLGRLNHEPEKIAGRRITDSETLEVTKMVYGGKMNMEITAALQRANTRAVGISGVSGGTVLAVKREPTLVKDPDTGMEKKVDFGYVGDITRVDLELVNTLVSHDYIPVIACMGVDGDGNILNINADTIAQEIATSAKAEKLIYVTDVQGVLEDKDEPSTVISYLDLAGARELLEDGRVSGGMRPKLLNCISAVEGGVERVHVIDGTAEHGLLMEIFTNQGCGTLMEKYRNGGDV